VVFQSKYLPWISLFTLQPQLAQPVMGATGRCGSRTQAEWVDLAKCRLDGELQRLNCASLRRDWIGPSWDTVMWVQ